MEEDIKKLMDRNTRIRKAFSPNAKAMANANSKANLITKMAMSRPVGKILDSSVGKGMVKVGNAVIGGVKKLTSFPDEGKMQRAQDAKNRANAPVGAVGGTNKGEYRPSSFRYGVQRRNNIA